MVHGLEKEYGARVKFLYLDIANPATESARAEYGFRSTPFFVLRSRSGEVVWSHTGNVDEAELRRQLNAVLQPR